MQPLSIQTQLLQDPYNFEVNRPLCDHNFTFSLRNENFDLTSHPGRLLIVRVTFH